MSLLVLALSPVTAPFSTCDLMDLLSGTSRAAGAILQSKGASDDSAPEADPSANLRVLRPTAAGGPIHLVPREPGRAPLLVPLRI